MGMILDLLIVAGTIYLLIRLANKKPTQPSSAGVCDGCKKTVSVRYKGSGKMLCQFCDDDSMGI